MQGLRAQRRHRVPVPQKKLSTRAVLDERAARVTTLAKAVLVLFIVEHAVLLAASVAFFVWIITFVGPQVQWAARMFGSGHSEQGRGQDQDLGSTLLVGAWAVLLAYSIVVPWVRRRIDGVSIAGAAVIAIALFAAGLVNNLALLILSVIYGVVVVLPAFLISWQAWGVRRLAG